MPPLFKVVPVFPAKALLASNSNIMENSLALIIGYFVPAMCSCTKDTGLLGDILDEEGEAGDN